MENSARMQLYDLLVTRDFAPEILDKRGDEVKNPNDAELFSFDYRGPTGKNYGTVVILLTADNELTVYSGDNLGRTMEPEDKRDWFGTEKEPGFLNQLKNLAVRNNIGDFNVSDLSKLKYTMQGMAAIKEGLFEGYYGNRTVSYSDQPQKTKLVIKHTRPIGEQDARYRNIDSLFVETEDGSRFRLPHRSLMGGKLMARHCAEGGNPYDVFGQHVNGMINELATLSKFLRVAKRKPLQGPAAEMVEAAVRHYASLKQKAKKMLSQKGYREERDNFDPVEISETELAVNEIKKLFIEQMLDERIENALPLLSKIKNVKDNTMKEADEFESWAGKVMEGTWALPETPEQEAKLKELMSAPLKVGPDALDATGQLYDIIGDDKLFDALGELAAADPDADARDIVLSRLKEIGYDTSDIMPDTDMEKMDEADRAPDVQRYKIPAVQRKQKGEPPLKLGDLKRKDTISDLENLKRLDRELHGEPVKEAQCNMTEQGQHCPVHGMRECWAESQHMENLDTDGVMMTRPSNMSSESRELDRLKKLAFG